MPDVSLGLLPFSARRAASIDREAFLRRLRSIAFACGAGVAVEGLIVMAAWPLGYGPYAAFHPALPSMPFHTALLAVLAGVGLCVRVPAGRDGAAPRGLAVAVMALSAYALAVEVFPLRGIPYPRVSSPQTALCFLFLAGSLLVFERSTSKGSRPAEGLALAAGSLALIASLGHLFRVGLLVGDPGGPPGVGMSIPTLAAIFALTLGILLARPDAGLMGAVTSAEPGGAAARPMLRGLLYVGPVLALIALGARRGWFDASFSAAIVAFLGLAWGAASILTTARRLNREAEARRRSEERASELFNQASDGIFIADLDGRYTEVNAAGCRMFGYSREELLGRTIMDMLAPEDLPRLLKDREDFLRGETRVSEWTVRRKDGTPLDIEVSAKILPDGRWQAFVRDITKRKEAEAVLKTTQERLQIFAALVDNSSDFIGIADPEGTPLYVNPAGRRMVGLDPDQRVEETRITEYYAEDQRAFAADVIVKEVFETGRWKGETAFRHWKTREAIPVWDEHFMIREPGSGRVLGIGTVTRDISERKKSEESLRQASERVELALRGADLAIWDWNVKTGETAFNGRWAEMRGYRPEEIRPHVDSWISGIHPDDLPRVRNALEEHLKGRGDYDAEHRVRTKAGGWIWVLDRGRVFARDENGEPLRMAGTELEVTARKKAEEELRTLRETSRFRTALEAAISAMLVVGRDGRVAFANREAERLFGWTREELAGRSVDVLVPERFRTGHAALRDSFFRSNVGRRPMGVARELSAVRKDGFEFPVEITLTRVEEGGESYVVASVSDISRRKAAEAALRESEQRFRLLVQGTHDYAIFMHDPRGRISIWNEGAERILGYRGDEIRAGSFHRFYPPEDVENGKPEADLRAAVERGSLEEEAWRVRKDGSRFWAGVLITPLADPDGRIIGYGKVLRDLTEKRRAREELLETDARLRRSVMELESFAYSVAHDLRSPLRAIEGYASVLADRLRDRVDPESRGMLEKMGRAALRLDHLIRDLLTYSAIAREDVVLEAVDLDPLVEHVSAHYPEVARARPRVRAPLGRALAQPSLLLQVLSNLLDNAVKFVPRDRAPVIEVWAERRGDGKVRLAVQDNGPGIPRDAWERVFQPFVSLAREGDGGTGIGLAIVKKAVERMGGRVFLESEPDRGSRFWIEMPEA